MFGALHRLRLLEVLNMLWAVSKGQFANRWFSQLNDERYWHVREFSPSKCGRHFPPFFGWVHHKIQHCPGSLQHLDGKPLRIQLPRLPVNKLPVSLRGGDCSENGAESPNGLQKCVGDFCCASFGGFAGDFPEGFFWAHCPTDIKRKIRWQIR